MAGVGAGVATDAYLTLSFSRSFISVKGHQCEAETWLKSLAICTLLYNLSLGFCCLDFL